MRAPGEALLALARFEAFQGHWVRCFGFGAEGLKGVGFEVCGWRTSEGCNFKTWAPLRFEGFPVSPFTVQGRAGLRVLRFMPVSGSKGSARRHARPCGAVPATRGAPHQDTGTRAYA